MSIITPDEAYVRLMRERLHTSGPDHAPAVRRGDAEHVIRRALTDLCKALDNPHLYPVTDPEYVAPRRGRK